MEAGGHYYYVVKLFLQEHKDIITQYLYFTLWCILEPAGCGPKPDMMQ